MKVKLTVIPKNEPEYAILHIHKDNPQKELFSSYLQMDGNIQKNIPVSKEGKLLYLPAETIYYIEAEPNSRIIYTAANAYHTNKRLYELTEELPSSFTRISKSVILNINYVRLYRPLPNGLMSTELKNDSYVYISRSYLNNLLKKLGV